MGAVGVSKWGPRTGHGVRWWLASEVVNHTQPACQRALARSGKTLTQSSNL